MTLVGTHKTRCMICGRKDDITIKSKKSMIDLCYSCMFIGIAIADRNTVVFLTKYVNDCHRLNPGCHYGSEFNNDCVDKFEEAVWLGFFRDWIKKSRRVY